MRYISVFLITLTLFLCVDGQSRSTRRKAPVKRTTQTFTATTPSSSTASDSLSTGLTVERYMSSYDLNADGTGKHTWEMEQRCSSELCLENIARFERVYNGSLEKVKILEAHILKANGSKQAVPVSAFSDKPTAQAEAAPGFSSLREFGIRFDGVAPGDAVSFKVELYTNRPHFDRRFDALEVFPVLYDWKSIEINVSAPANYPLFVEGTGLEGGKLVDLDGRSRWQFRKQNVARIDLEPMLQDFITTSPRFAMTTFQSFEELGSAYWASMKVKATVTPEIKSLADAITKGTTDPSQQASLIYEWVNKNIRYLSVVLDRGGWVPHSATEIIANRYGDCKDYTTVIHTLLKAKGIESVPVLIRSDFSDWFPKVATADYFNHAILYIPSINLFADATTPNTRLGLIPQPIVGKNAVLAGEKTGLIRVPDNDPAANQVLSDVSIEFQPNGDLSARTRNTYVGRSEIVFRPMFGETSFQKYSATFVRTLLAFFGIDGRGNVVNITNPFKVGEPFSVDIEAKIDNYTTFLPKGAVPLPAGISMVNMRGLERFAMTDARRTNLYVGATTFRENFLITPPSDVTFTTKPRVAEFTNSIGRFKIATDVKEGKQVLSRELVLSVDVVQPKDYPAFKELVGKMLDVHDMEIEYTADPSLLREKSKELRTSHARSGSQPGALAEALYAGTLPTKLKPADIRRLESNLVADQNDVDTRLRLLRYYSLAFTPKGPATKTAAVRHRKWLIQNRPDIDDYTIFGLSQPHFDPDSDDFRQLKDAWLLSVAKGKGNSQIRLNAVDFLRKGDTATAARLLREGIELDRDNYKLPLEMTDILKDEFEAKETTPSRKTEVAKELLELGKVALVLIKKERGDERDADRGQLLTRISYAAIEVGDLDAATAYARELVLDFGQSAADQVYDEAAHVGNVILGLVELRRNNPEKAREHLLIAIRAPLRKNYNSLSQIDTRLARELYERGEKAAVLEYLRLCLNLGNLKEYPESHADEIKALKLWQEQITKGVVPSFDFGAP